MEPKDLALLDDPIQMAPNNDQNNAVPMMCSFSLMENLVRCLERSQALIFSCSSPLFPVSDFPRPRGFSVSLSFFNEVVVSSGTKAKTYVTLTEQLLGPDPSQNRKIPQHTVKYRCARPRAHIEETGTIGDVLC